MVEKVAGWKEIKQINREIWARESGQAGCPKEGLTLSEQPFGKYWLVETKSLKLGLYGAAALPADTLPVFFLEPRDTAVSRMSQCVLRGKYSWQSAQHCQ